MKIITLPCLVSLLAVNAAWAADDCAPFQAATGSYQFVREASQNPERYAGNGVGEIIYTRLPIFDESDPDENNALFRWANRFHILTRQRTVSQQLLFQSGQDYDHRLLEESARLLRAQGYFYDADIRPLRQCGNLVDIEVITRDNWSFTPNLAFDRSGGENTWSVGLRDSNILGLGKELSIAGSRDTDRRSRELVYEDRNVGGTRLRNRSVYIDSDDGATQSFELGLPFFSLDSTRSWLIDLESQDREDEQFFRGDDVSEVVHDIRDFSLEYGFSGGLQRGNVQRWSFGYRYREDRFGVSDELPPPAQFPIDKELSYPFFKYESVEDNFTTAFNLDQIYRTEDLHLGKRLINRLGYAAADFGSDSNRIVMDGFFGDTLVYNDDELWQHSLAWEAMWNLDRDAAEDLLISYETRYFHRQTGNRSFFAGFEAVYSKNLNTHQQVVMGGFSGARAFDNRFQVGDRSVLLTLEERIYTDIHLWNLIRVGGALFIDVGRAWEPGADSGMEDDYLADIGFGLRLMSSKAASGRVAHIDFAFPLTNRDDRDVDSVQIGFTVKGTF